MIDLLVGVGCLFGVAYCVGAKAGEAACCARLAGCALLT